jgi:hypothetical protein
MVSWTMLDAVGAGGKGGREWGGVFMLFFHKLGDLHKACNDLSKGRASWGRSKEPIDCMTLSLECCGNVWAFCALHGFVYTCIVHVLMFCVIFLVIFLECWTHHHIEVGSNYYCISLFYIIWNNFGLCFNFSLFKLLIKPCDIIV